MAELDKPTEELHIAAQESIRIRMISIVAPLLALNALVDGLPIASMPSQEDLWTQDAILDRLSRVGRNAIKDKERRWESGVIPYSFSSSFSSEGRKVVEEAMKEFESKTCIRFTPRSSERDYIHIYSGSGCNSVVGRVGMMQGLSLAPGCLYKGIAMHELMHATGFWHEQTRADRDEHVEVHLENVVHGYEFAFDKYGLDTIDHLGAEYDTCSVMHYPETAFSKNGKKTIESKSPDTDECVIGQREGFSDTDIRKINTLYQCEGLPQVDDA